MQLQFRVEGKGGGEFEANFLVTSNGRTVGRQGVPFALRHDEKCSREHALIYVGADGQVWVKDLKSRNGTWINGRKISLARLTVGDMLQVGSTCMTLMAAMPEADDVETSLPSFRPARSANQITHEICNQFPESLYCSGLSR